MALEKAAALAANTLLRIHHKNGKSTKPRGKSANNPLEGNPQLPQSTVGIRKTFLNQQGADWDRRVNFRIFFSPSASHTAKPGKYLLPVFAHQFRCLTWDVNLSAKLFNIIFVTITDFQRLLQMAFLTDLKIWLLIKWAAPTQFASCLLLGKTSCTIQSQKLLEQS